MRASRSLSLFAVRLTDAPALVAAAGLVAALAAGLGGCSHAPVTGGVDPRILFESVCGKGAPGATVRSVTGSVWLKAQSREASGQFPASVEVKPGGAVLMEVTNLVGGVEALIRVEGNRYSIEIPKEKPENRRQTGNSSWGGIPLHWAGALFLGRIPCPPQNAIAEMVTQINAAGELQLETQPSLEREAEVFRYRIRKTGTRFWPDTLHWERKGVAPVSVDFSFDDPEEKTGSPRKWEARSQMGEVKVRWRDREPVLAGPEQEKAK